MSDNERRPAISIDLSTKREDLAHKYEHLFGGLDEARKAFRVDTRSLQQRTTSEMNKRRWRDPKWSLRMREIASRVRSTESAKLQLAEAGRTYWATDEARRQKSLERGGIMIKTVPFFLRGASNQDIIAITLFNSEQVRNARNNLTRAGRLRKPSKEQESISKSKAHLGKKKNRPREYTPEQEKNILMSRKLLEAGMIPDDPSLYTKLEAVQRMFNLPFPEFFAARLNFEIWLSIVSDRTGTPTLARHHANAGNSVDAVWFKEVQLKYRKLYGQIVQSLKVR